MLTVDLSVTNGDALQDLNYYYDAVDNITFIRDDAQDTVFYKNSVISPHQDFTYDALYRLITAKGREQTTTPSFAMRKKISAQDRWKKYAQNFFCLVSSYS